MSAERTWPIRVAGIGPLAMGTVLWSVQGQLNATVVAKACFTLVPDGAMTVRGAEPIRVADAHPPDRPVGSLIAVRETAPLLQQVDVVVYGHAHAPADDTGTRRASHAEARLVVRRDQHALVDKRLLVYGRREAPGTTATFARIPLGYELALGGIGHGDNPLGVGLGASTGPQPNLVHPEDPLGTVATLAPLPSTFPCRRALLGATARSALEQEVLELPASFDWRYFQCAPPDQRTEALRGDEWIELSGLTAEHDQLRTQLPDLHAAARVYGAAQLGVPDSVPLRADLLQIDADGLSCSLVWRGSFPIPSLSAAEQLVIAGALASRHQPISWPATVEQIPAEAFHQPANHHAAGAAPSFEGAPDSGVIDNTTIALDVHDDAPRAARRAPAEAAVAPGESAKAPRPGESPAEGTHVMTADELAMAGVTVDAPFQLARPGAPAAGRDGPAGGTAPALPWEQGRNASGSAGSPAGARPAPAAPMVGASSPAPALVPPAAAAPPEPAPVLPATAAGAAPVPPAPPAASPALANVPPTTTASAVDESARADAQGAAEQARRERDAAEAEARRRAEAERFAAEQAAARAEQESRAEEAAQRRKQQATKLKTGLYGRFRKGDD